MGTHHSRVMAIRAAESPDTSNMLKLRVAPSEANVVNLLVFQQVSAKQLRLMITSWTPRQRSQVLSPHGAPAARSGFAGNLDHVWLKWGNVSCATTTPPGYVSGYAWRTATQVLLHSVHASGYTPALIVMRFG